MITLGWVMIGIPSLAIASIAAYISYNEIRRAMNGSKAARENIVFVVGCLLAISLLLGILIVTGEIG